MVKYILWFLFLSSVSLETSSLLATNILLRQICKTSTTTMPLRTWESSHTHHAWSTTASPIFLLLVCLVANIIALIVSIVINVTSANEPGNDFGPG